MSDVDWDEYESELATVYDVEEDVFTSWAHRNAAMPADYGYSPTRVVWPRSAKIIAGVVVVTCVCLTVEVIRGAIELAQFIAGAL